MHDAFPEDTLDGRLRVILHADHKKAAIWDWTSHPDGGGMVLKLMHNLDGSNACKGCYLAHLPSHNSVRDDNSFYLVATPDAHEAAIVNLQHAAAYQQSHE